LVTMSRSLEAQSSGMSRFSQFLLAKQLLMQEQLEQALQHQAVYGARLGTNLVELRILTVERLAECLSEFHRIPLPPRAWLERPKRNAVERVTRPLVERIRFIPMRLENNNILHAAVLDPNDPRTLDDLRFATGCKIHPYVLPEIWMHDWLFSLFKLPRGIRHIDPNDDGRELEKPAQAYDFQAAQAAQAALAAKANRIMVPAVVGVVGPDDARPAGERKTLQGADRAAVMAAAGSPAQRSGPPADVQARALGERTSFQGAPRDRITAQGAPARASDRSTSGSPARASDRTTAQPAEREPARVTAQGAEREPSGPARVTAQGAERHVGGPARVTAQGAERQVAGPARVTAQGAERHVAGPARVTAQGAERQATPVGRAGEPGAERQPAGPPRTTSRGAERDAIYPARVGTHAAERQPAPAARLAAQGSEAQFAAPTRVTAQGAERHAPTAAAVSGDPHVTFTDKDAELFPSVATGASVRPPPIAMKSLSDLGGRTSLPNVSGISSGGFAPPMSPMSEAPSMWEPEAPTSPAIAALREALRPAPEPEVAEPPPLTAATAPAPRATELSELEQTLRQVTDRDQLIEISFAIASRFARVVALFMVHRGMVQGVRCLEEGETRAINGVLIPLESASMLTHAANQFVPFRIDPRERPMDLRVQQLLTPRVVNEVGLFPVVVKQRAVNLLYASHGSEPLGPIAFGALSLLAEQMGAAYGQLILNRKGSG
jgi:hypothetical protein